jgi:hypothetical protein
LAGRKLIWPRNRGFQNLLWPASNRWVDGEPGGRELTAEKIRAAIEGVGISSIDETVAVPVCLRKRSKEKSRK